MAEKYNGWSNYETWCLKLWLDNSQGDQEWTTEQAERVLDADEGFDVHDFATSLEDMLQEGMPEIENNVYSDILTAGVGRIDWREIAEAYIVDNTP